MNMMLTKVLFSLEIVFFDTVAYLIEIVNILITVRTHLKGICENKNRETEQVSQSFNHDTHDSMEGPFFKFLTLTHSKFPIDKNNCYRLK